MKKIFTFYTYIFLGLFLNAFTVKSQTNAVPTLIPGTTYQSFDAVSGEKSVDLKWITVSELNHSHFEVERSFDRSDFKTIALVLDGFPNAENNKVYEFRENSRVVKGRQVIYYRLKQFDLDGKYNYSVVLAVRFQEKAGVAMQVSHHPFSNDKEDH